MQCVPLSFNLTTGCNDIERLRHTGINNISSITCSFLFIQYKAEHVAIESGRQTELNGEQQYVNDLCSDLLSCISGFRIRTGA